MRFFIDGSTFTYLFDPKSLFQSMVALLHRLSPPLFFVQHVDVFGIAVSAIIECDVEPQMTGCFYTIPDKPLHSS